MKLLILSDIHANWQALDTVLRHEINWDCIAFCGDLVDYGPQPARCVRWLANNADHVVRGNHDNALAFDVDCQCMGTFREYSLATRAWHRSLLDKLDCGFLRGMPTLAWFECAGTHFRMAHATPQGGLFEYLDEEHWRDRIGETQSDFILLGHTHVQGMRTFGAQTVVNPGSVGLARDHPGRACYGVHEDGRMQLKQVAYDVDRTVAALRAAPLAEPVIEGLVRVLGARSGSEPCAEA